MEPVEWLRNPILPALFLAPVVCVAIVSRVVFSPAPVRAGVFRFGILRALLLCIQPERFGPGLRTDFVL